MKWSISMLFLAIIVANTGSTIAQDKAGPGVKDFSSLINQVFAPVTDKLNLTQEQQFQIVAIITEAEIRADPLLQSLAVADQQLSELSFSGAPDGNRLKELCDQEAAILSEIMQMKVRAKAGIVRLLTTEQRAIVAQQFNLKTQLEGHLGSITIY
jgi:Spy/CpxP family protein refolding chaperone